MHWALKTESRATAVSVVSLAEAKLHCRVDIDDEDVLIEGWLEAALNIAETLTDRAIAATSFTYFRDGFYDMPFLLGARPLPQRLGGGWPGLARNQEIALPRPPLLSITSIKYLDVENVLQTMDPSLYVVDDASEPGRVTPVFGTVWPVTYLTINAVRIAYTAGGATETERRAMLMMVSHWHLHRDATAVNFRQRIDELPVGIRMMLASDDAGVYP